MYNLQLLLSFRHIRRCFIFNQPHLCPLPSPIKHYSWFPEYCLIFSFSVSNNPILSFSPSSFLSTFYQNPLLFCSLTAYPQVISSNLVASFIISSQNNFQISISGPQALWCFRSLLFIVFWTFKTKLNVFQLSEIKVSDQKCYLTFLGKTLLPPVLSLQGTDIKFGVLNSFYASLLPLI